MLVYKIKKTHHVSIIQIVTNTNLDPLLIVDPSDHPHTHLGHLVEVRLLQANISQDLDDPLPDTNTCVLCEHGLKGRSV